MGKQGTQEQAAPRTLQEIAAEAQAKIDAEDAGEAQGGAEAFDAGQQAPEAQETPKDPPKPRRRIVENPDASEREKRLAELRPELEKLGLKVDGEGITTKEFAALRQERRKAEEKLAQARAEVDARLAQFEKESATYGKLRQVIAERDVDTMARLMGFESFGKMATEYATVGNDPALREARAVKEQLAALRAEQAAERRAAQEAAERARHEAEVTAARQQFLTEMVDGLKSHELPEIQRLAEDSDFQSLVYQIQQESYRESGGETFLDTADAAELAFEKVRASYERLNPVFQARAPERPPAGARNGERRTPTVVSQKTATEASGASSRPLSKDEWIAKHKGSIERALRSER